MTSCCWPSATLMTGQHTSRTWRGLWTRSMLQRMGAACSSGPLCWTSGSPPRLTAHGRWQPRASKASFSMWAPACFIACAQAQWDAPAGASLASSLTVWLSCMLQSLHAHCNTAAMRHCSAGLTHAASCPGVLGHSVFAAVQGCLQAGQLVASNPLPLHGSLNPGVGLWEQSGRRIQMQCSPRCT